MLHKHDKSPDALESNIRGVADRLGIREDELGLTSKTVEIEPGSTGSTIREKLAFAYEAIREDIDEFDRTATPVDMMKVVAFGVLALIIGGAVGAVLAYMP